MSKMLLCAVACAAISTLPPTNGTAQRIPGMPGGDGFSAAANQAEFLADVMFHTDSVLKEWRAAWADDDVDALLELYTDDAVLIFEQDEPVRGHEAMRAKLEALLRESGEAQVSIGDFDASGRMGMVSGLLTVQLRNQSGSRTTTGIHLTVLTRDRRDWKIRTQVVRLGTDGGRATAPVDTIGPAARRAPPSTPPARSRLRSPAAARRTG